MSHSIIKNTEVLRLASLGYWLIPWQGRKSATDKVQPLVPGYNSHKPTVEEVGVWLRQYLYADWAILPTDMVVLDLECRDGKDGLADFRAMCHAAGQTFDAVTKGAFITHTRNNGYHLWFRAPQDWTYSGSLYLNPGKESVELKRNASVHVPPSFGYTAESRLENPTTAPELPAFVVALANNLHVAKQKVDYATPTIGLGNRRAFALSYAGSMRERQAATPEIIAAALKALRDERFEDPDSFTDEEINGIAKSIGRAAVTSEEGLLAAGDQYALGAKAFVDSVRATKAPAPKVEEEEEVVVVVNDEPMTPEESVREAMELRRHKLPDSVLKPNRVFKLWHDWSHVSSKRFQPEMTLLTALTTLGTVMGRSVDDESGMRAIIYGMAILATGAGKSAAVEQSGALLKAIGREANIGRSAIGSGDGMISELSEAGEKLWIWDEFGAMMREWQMSTCPTYKQLIKTMFLTWFSGQDWGGKSIKDLTESVNIPSPHPCLLATIQAKTFQSYANAEMITEGLMGRFLFTSNPQFVMRGTNITPKTDECIPEELVCIIKQRTSETQTLAMQGELSRPRLRLTRLPKDHAAITEMMVESERKLARLHCTDENACAVSMRAWEKASRLAMIHAWSADEFIPHLTREGFEWGVEVVKHSDAVVMDLLHRTGADTGLIKNIEVIKNVIRWYGRSGCPVSTMKARARLKVRDFDEAFSSAIDSQDIVQVKTARGHVAYTINERKAS